MKFGPSDRLIIEARNGIYGPRYTITLPPMACEYGVDTHAMRMCENYIPFLREAIARECGRQHGERIQQEVLKQLKEIK